MFDLANLSVNCEFDDAADDRLLARVRRRRLGATRSAQLALMKVMSEMREGMWAVVQQAISTLTTSTSSPTRRAARRTAGSCAPIARFATWLDEARHH